MGDDVDFTDYFTWLDDRSWIRVSACVIVFDRARKRTLIVRNTAIANGVFNFMCGAVKVCETLQESLNRELDVRIRERTQIVLLAAEQGMTVPEITRIVRRNDQTVRIWLNIAEIELSVLKRQCLRPRLPNIETVRHEVAAWQARQNDTHAKIDWRFTTTDARIKLKRLYPIVNVQ